MRHPLTYFFAAVFFLTLATILGVVGAFGVFSDLAPHKVALAFMGCVGSLTVGWVAACDFDTACDHMGGTW